MQVLKILFQQREARNVEFLGSELLMPLLRLLETDLAPQALEVLEEPLVISGGGPAARHILRMSMHFGSLPSLHSDPDSAPVIFGVPQESGWSIAQEDALRETCRANIMAVFDSCSVPTRPSRIEFEPEVEGLASIKTPLADDLGGLVKNLHELNDFFTNESPDLLLNRQQRSAKCPRPLPLGGLRLVSRRSLPNLLHPSLMQTCRKRRSSMYSTLVAVWTNKMIPMNRLIAIQILIPLFLTHFHLFLLLMVLPNPLIYVIIDFEL
jgi:hypothetical protein